MTTIIPKVGDWQNIFNGNRLRQAIGDMWPVYPGGHKLVPSCRWSIIFKNISLRWLLTSFSV